MKNSGKLLLASLLLIMLVMPFVVAATPGGVLATIGDKIFGFTGFSTGTGTEVVVQLMIWLILFVAFADILELIFSNATRWIIGFGLAVIAANVGWVAQLGSIMFSSVAALGSFSVAAVIGVSFIAFLLAHFGIGWAVAWIKNARRMKDIREATDQIEAGAQGLSRVGKNFQKIGSPKNIIGWIIGIVVIILIVWTVMYSK